MEATAAGASLIVSTHHVGLRALWPSAQPCGPGGGGSGVGRSATETDDGPEPPRLKVTVMGVFLQQVEPRALPRNRL